MLVMALINLRATPIDETENFVITSNMFSDQGAAQPVTGWRLILGYPFIKGLTKGVSLESVNRQGGERLVY